MGLAGLLFTIALPVHAQEAQSESSLQRKDGQADAGIQDIVVTAQRREQKLQDVPIAISAFTAERLDQAGITTSYDLTFLAPGLNFGRI